MQKNGVLKKIKNLGVLDACVCEKSETQQRGKTEKGVLFFFLLWKEHDNLNKKFELLFFLSDNNNLESF